MLISVELKVNSRTHKAELEVINQFVNTFIFFLPESSFLIDFTAGSIGLINWVDIY